MAAAAAAVLAGMAGAQSSPAEWSAFLTQLRSLAQMQSAENAPYTVEMLSLRAFQIGASRVLQMNSAQAVHSDVIRESVQYWLKSQCTVFPIELQVCASHL